VAVSFEYDTDVTREIKKELAKSQLIMQIF
jgi:hypothetical protein